MNKHDITATLRKAGSNQSKIGLSLGLSNVTISMVVGGVARSSRVEQRISEVTGLPLHQLWPQWYAKPSSLEFSPDLLIATSARLCAELRRFEFSSAEISDLVGTTLSLQYAFEKGKASPPAVYLARLADAIGVDVLYILTGRRESARAEG